MQSAIDKLDGAAQHLSQRRFLLAGLIGTVLIMLGFQWLKNQLGTVMLDEIPGYTPDALTRQMQIYGDSGRRLHMIFTLSLDMVFPLVYGGFFAGLLALVARPIGLKAVAAPVLAVMALDYAENLQIAVLLASFPALGTAQIEAASATTLAKFWAIRLTLYWLLGLLLWRLINALRHRAG